MRVGGASKARNYAAIAAADRVFLLVVYAAAAVFVLLVAMLFIELVHGSWPSIQAFKFKFLWTSQ